MKDQKKYSSIANSNILAEDEMKKTLGGACDQSCKTGCSDSCKPGNKVSISTDTTPAP